MHSLKVGMVLYHKKDGIDGAIQEIDKDIIFLKFKKQISGKYTIKFTTRQIGEWIFFKREDIGLSVERIVEMPEYMKYGNPSLIKAKAAIEEEAKRKREQKREEERKRAQEEIARKKKAIKKAEIIEHLNIKYGRHRLFFSDGQEETGSIESITADEMLDPIFGTGELFISDSGESFIKDIIDKRNIRCLVHFTRIDNLRSILDNGLVPVKLQKELNIDSTHNDYQRIDEKLNCTSCSVEFPNYKLFYKFRKSKFPGETWVVIVLDIDLLLSENNESYFCQTNAARVLPSCGSKYRLRQGEAFDEMFCEYATDKQDRKINRSSLQIPDSYTTDPQAEILIGGIIDPKHILCICFENKFDFDIFKRIEGSGLPSEYEYQVIPDLFGPRKDYVHW